MNFNVKSVLMGSCFISSYVMGMAQAEQLNVPSQTSMSLLFIRSDGAVYWANFSDRETSLMKKEIQGSFLWYEKNGTGHLVVDPLVLSKITELSHELDAINENDPNRPKILKRGDSYTPSDSCIAKRREIHNIIESMCEQAIKDGHTTLKSRPTAPQLP